MSRRTHSRSNNIAIDPLGDRFEPMALCAIKRLCLWNLFQLGIFNVRMLKEKKRETYL